MHRNKLFTTLGFLAAFALILFSLNTALAGDNNTSRTAPENALRGPAKYNPSPNAILLTEDFEEGIVPPTGWVHVQNNPTETWSPTDFNPYAGTWNVNTLYDPNLVQQDEWLVSGALFLDSSQTNTLSMWSLGSLFWCRDTNDNCDLEVWLIQGPDIGDADDMMIYLADDDWDDAVSYTWSQSVIDLSPDLPASGAVRIGLRYVGVDGAEIGVDDVILDGTAGVPTDVSLTELGGEIGSSNLWTIALLLVAVSFTGALVLRRGRQI